jgi:alpha-beta hydrolase superfamily lysophospholipase
VKIQDGWIESADGNRLFWRHHAPDTDPRAVLLIVHGLAEHSGRYLHVLDHFANAGFDCWAHDYRSHGQSPGLRVHVSEFDEFLTDLAAARSMVCDAQPDLPFFLIGHSQGGLIVLREALAHPEGLDGIVVSSPFLGLHPDAAPPAVLHMVANIVSTFAPKLMFSKVAEPSALSRDPAVPEAYVADPLVSTTVSARWFTSVLKAHADTHARASSLRLPALVMQSGDDRLTDPAATRQWVSNAPADLVDYVEWEGLYHEMFNEPEKEEVFARVEQWLEKRLAEQRLDV